MRTTRMGPNKWMATFTLYTLGRNFTATATSKYEGMAEAKARSRVNKQVNRYKRQLAKQRKKNG
jgi:hypothetical protein